MWGRLGTQQCSNAQFVLSCIAVPAPSSSACGTCMKLSVPLQDRQLPFGSVLKKSFGKDTETRCVSPRLVVQNMFINVMLVEGRVKQLLPCQNESNSTMFVCVCARKDHL